MERRSLVWRLAMATTLVWPALVPLVAAQQPAARQPATTAAQATPQAPAQAKAPSDPPPSSSTAKGTASAQVPKGEAAKMESRPASNISFHPGHGVQVKSNDGDFQLNMKVRFQLRYTLDHVAGNTSQSFAVHRARVEFSGHVFGEHNTFHFQLAVSPHDVGLNSGGATGPTHTPVLDAFMTFTQLRDANLQVGQYKAPFSRERVMSDSAMELVDRSITNGEFNLDRSLGFDIRSKDVAGLGGKLRYYAGIYTGLPRDSFQQTSFHMMYVARVEVLPLGKFDDYSEADFARTMDPRLSLGLAYAFVDHARGTMGVLGGPPTDGGTTQMHVGTADAFFKFGGLDVLAVGYLRHGTRNLGGAGAPEAARNGVGVTAQAGYLIPNLPIGVAARYSAIRGTGTTSLPDRNALGGGVSWYFARHPFKLQADYFHYWGQIPHDDQFRVQLQTTL